MSTKPILFNTDMVRAILDGQKSVTRRVVNPQPREHMHHVADGTIYGYWMDGNCQPYRPPYHPGDILYVKETWNGDWCDHYIYKADSGSAIAVGYGKEPKWHPSIHMPREAARIFLRVTDVRVERLQDIQKEDVIKEGIAPKKLRIGGCKCAWAVDGCLEKPCNNREAYEEMCYTEPFAELWDSTVKPAGRILYGWAANPWCWVIQFERISKEEATA